MEQCVCCVKFLYANDVVIFQTHSALSKKAVM